MDASEKREEESPQRKKSCCTSFWQWIGTPSFYIYTNFFLGAWGDRMWRFSVGMYLVVLSDGLLRLAAIFGLVSGVSVLIFGGIIGNWVDNTRRLTAIRISLFLQNLLTMISAIAVYLTIYYEEEINSTWSGGVLKTVCEASIVMSAVLAGLASVAYKICIEKDWIVVVAGANVKKLTNLNAVIRAIDLSCKVLAPTCSGFIMSYASLQVSALVIAGWNLVSVFIEYALLRKVYSLVPHLSLRKSASSIRQMQSKTSNHENENATESEQLKLNTTAVEKVDEVNMNDNKSVIAHEEQIPLNDKENHERKEKEEEAMEDEESNSDKKKSIAEIMFNPCVILFKSWRVYIKQEVVFAGISLSFLYMTVLGFDSITVGFIYANGVSELAVGISMATAGVTGIIGTFLFTRLRPRIGLERTGLFAYTIEIALLSLCVVSIFAPGSPFIYNYKPGMEKTTGNNGSCVVKPTMSPIPIDVLNVTTGNESDVHNIRKRDLLDALQGNQITLTHMDLSKTINDGNITNGIPHSWIWPVQYGSNHHWTSVDIVEGVGEMKIDSSNTEDLIAINHIDLSILQSYFKENNTSILSPSSSVINASSHRILLQNKTPAKYMLLKSNPKHTEGFHEHKLIKRQASDNGRNTEFNSTLVNYCEEEEAKEFNYEDYISVSLLLIGIVASRVGLWMADLTVTQLLQENVAENERGAVGGVQNSLNMVFDLLKFVVVIFVPYIQTFGYLIIMSFVFIFTAGCFFSFHVYRVQGNVFSCCGSSNNNETSKSLENGKAPVEV